MSAARITATLVLLSLVLLRWPVTPALAESPVRTLRGASFDFEELRETTLSPGDPEVLLAAPELSGNSLHFRPQHFRAEATGGVDRDHSELDVFIQATPGATIGRVLVSQSGSATLSDRDASTGVTIAVSGTITVLETLDGPLPEPVILSFADSGADVASRIVPSNPITANGTTEWTGEVSFDLAGFVRDATRAQLTLSSVLTAGAALRTTASVSQQRLTLTAIALPAPRRAG